MLNKLKYRHFQMAFLKRYITRKHIISVIFVVLLIVIFYCGGIGHNGVRQGLLLRVKCNMLDTDNCFPELILDTKSVVKYYEDTLEEALREDKGTGCDIPKLNPFDQEVMKFNKKSEPITCHSVDWVKCYMSKCKVVPKIIKTVKNIKCIIKDILYINDKSHRLGQPNVIGRDLAYTLVNSDHVKINCTGLVKNDTSFKLEKKIWVGHGIGFRNSIKAKKPPLGREDTINVLIFGFDSTSKNGFIRKMPLSYKVLTEELGATVLHGYNIVGDGTQAALLPILTGKTEIELPEVRKGVKGSGYTDQMPFIFYKLKEDGYRTAYLEDMPWMGTFQYRFNGFLRQPADHYLRAFYMEESNNGARFYKGWKNKNERFCVGDTPQFQIMINITEQFLKLDGKRFAFTFIADITHDNFNAMGAADVSTADFFRRLKSQGHLENTFFVVMGDHGVRYETIRNTYQGKFEERLALMAIRIPEKLRALRPEIQAALESNSEVLTTPHDIHATVLDAMDMRKYWNPYKVKGADLPRGMTLFQPISRNRSCSEAGIQPHWCTCLKWQDVSQNDPSYSKAVEALVEHINSITEFVRSKCAIRRLVTIQWVVRRQMNKRMQLFEGSRDDDGYIGRFTGDLKTLKDIYQVQATLSPANAIYEATVTLNNQDDSYQIDSREISRTNAYGNEPKCLKNKYPHLNKFCYCNNDND